MTRIATLTLAALAACANTTGGDLIKLPLEAGGVARDSTQPLTIASPMGWTITLQQAVIAVGPLYFNVDPPPTGEFRSGTVIIEATEQTIVDALDPTLHDVPGGADGETGHAVSVEIGLLPPDQTNQLADPCDAEIIGGGFAYITGSAVMGTTTVPFQGQIVVDNTLVTTTEPLADLQRIKGAGVDLTFTAAPSELDLRVDPSHWFDQTDFSQIATGAPPIGGYTWMTDSTFAAQLLQGVKTETDVYNFQLVPDGS
ncbi:MAG TPA: hypothetical protein VMJ10_18910 [Kofleriaceae bacterium]|nr:hypothetical protein [Kofleriaceae bacterium]